MDTHEIAWAAGFFDGEGSVFISRREPLDINLAVAQTESSLDALERFHRAIFGLGNIRGPYRYKTNQRPYFHLKLGRWEDIQAVVALLWRWLSAAKRRQASYALREWARLKHERDEMWKNRGAGLCMRGHVLSRQKTTGKPYCLTCMREARLRVV